MSIQHFSFLCLYNTLLLKCILSRLIFICGSMKFPSMSLNIYYTPTYSHRIFSIPFSCLNTTVKVNSSIKIRVSLLHLSTLWKAWCNWIYGDNDQKPHWKDTTSTCDRGPSIENFVSTTLVYVKWDLLLFMRTIFSARHFMSAIQRGGTWNYKRFALKAHGI